MFLNRLILQFLIVLFVTGLSGSNALVRMNGEAPLPGQLCNIEQVLEAETESFGPEDLTDSGFDPGSDHITGVQPFFGSAYIDLHICCTGLICQMASIRQSQVNLLNSFAQTESLTK
jgi:hypothetical protein